MILLDKLTSYFSRSTYPNQAMYQCTMYQGYLLTLVHGTLVHFLH